MILAMPNTKPPIFDAETLDLALDAAREKARCDYAQYLGAGPDNAAEAARLAPKAAALKMYLDSTFGELRLDDMTLVDGALPSVAGRDTHRDPFREPQHGRRHLDGADVRQAHPHRAHFPARGSAADQGSQGARDQGDLRSLPASFVFDCTLPTQPSAHLGHGGGSRRGGRAEVRPRLATQKDVDALWENLDVIDCFATDHAPHTLAEKDGENPPPGFPGVETMLPLLLTAVSEGRLTIDDIIQKSVINPRRIFKLPEQPETWVEVDENAEYEIKATDLHSRCGWTPFEGWKVKGKVRKVVLRGQDSL